MVNQWLLTKELIVDVVANTTNKNFKYSNIKQTSIWDTLGLCPKGSGCNS
jgi:hypothetical protein